MERIIIDTEQKNLEQASASKRDANHNKTAKRLVELQIGGRKYRIRSEMDEDWLKQVAAGVDEAMRRIREHSDTVDSLEVAVLTALNLSRELLQLRERIAARGEGGATPAKGMDDLRELIELVESEVEAGSEARDRKRESA